MTEAEWNACDEPMPMSEFLRGKASERKLRLFGAACCRSVWRILADSRSRQAIETAERHAGGSASNAELDAAAGLARAAFQAAITPACRDAHAPRTPACAAARAVIYATFTDDPIKRAGAAAWDAANAAAREHYVNQAGSGDFLAERRRAYSLQAGMLRDIFGPMPFSPFRLDPAWAAWNDGMIRRMAQAIYNTRAFDRLPLLADALEEAGCDNTDILAHCRQPGEHVRGCWVVDLLLGKQ